MKILFALLGTLLLIVSMLMGGPLAAFINLPSVLIVVGGMCFFSLAHHSPGEIKEAIQHALGTDPSPNLQKDLSVIATIRKTTYGSGVAGTLIGLVQMLQSLDDPKSIGPAMAVAMLTVLYSVLLAEFLIDPMANRLLSRTNSKEGSTTITPPPQSAHAVGMVFGIFLCFFVLILAMT